MVAWKTWLYGKQYVEIKLPKTFKNTAPVPQNNYHVTDGHI